MREDRTLEWLEPRLADAPPELAADILELVSGLPDLDHSDPVAALAAAAMAGLTQVAAGTGERSEALRLLAADAALTYAFEAAAETGRSGELAERIGLGGELGLRLAREVRGPGHAGAGVGS